MVPEKPFPLLKLPPQALERTFGLMRRLDLIPLSLLSKKTARAILLNNIAPKGYEVKYTDKTKSIKITFIDNTSFEWKFKKYQAQPYKIHEFKIGDITVTCMKTNCGLITFSSTIPQNLPEAVLFHNIFRFFLKTFPAGITELHLDLTMESEKTNMKNKENGFLKLLAQNEATFCDNLILSGSPESKILNFALTKIMVSKILTIKSKVSKNYVLPETVHAQCLIIQKGDWILSSGGIFSANAKFCRLQNVLLREKCVNVIQRFLETPSAPSLEWLTVELQEGNLNIRELIDGFGAKEWEIGRRDGYFTQFHGEKLIDIDCRKGFDIQRADGLLATVILTEPEKSGFQQFHLIIWHNRFPNAENLRLRRENIGDLSEKELERNRKLRENEAKIKKNEEDIERMTLEIEELRADNAAQKLGRDSFESILVMMKKLQTDNAT